jgi:eukaryotic-like serine/threonine-protein kinase
MDDATRWKELERVFHAALTLAPGEREKYLRAACESDQELRARVDSLLRHDTATATDELSSAWTKTDGPRIGPYKVLAKLGSGGMGEVYLAQDTRLDRKVAVKVLPARFATDQERKNRFLRETKVTATFNHPNIVAVYDVGTEGSIDYLVMEYVPGKSLDQVIPSDGLKIKRALTLAVQIADALDRAHAAGIIHRDLKPANVIIAESGVAKVLDFGIAKHFGASSPVTMETQDGAILGTAAYMSPEQAQGKPVDARSDIFSFGSMLYEMLTGRRAFHRESAASTLSAVLNDNPPEASTIADDVPHEVNAVINRCLAKSPSDRFQTISEVKRALQSILNGIESGKPKIAPAPSRPLYRGRIFAALACVLLAAIGGYAWLFRDKWFDDSPQRPGPSAPVAFTSYPGDELCPSFSPDGTAVAFARNASEVSIGRSGNFDIYIKTIGSDESVRLTSNPADEFSPAWSPDGRYIAFLRTEAPGRFGVFLIPPIGGRERRISEVRFTDEIGPFVGAWLAWFPDGESLAISDKGSADDPTTIYALSIRGGEKHRLTSPPDGDDDRQPSISPDSGTLLFTRMGRNSFRIYQLNLTPDHRPHTEPVRLINSSADNHSASWSPDGRSIIFGHGSSFNDSLWRLRWPKASAQTAKIERLTFADDGILQPALSRQGRLVYPQISGDVDIWRIGVNGAKSAGSPPVRLISSTRLDHDMRYSPDGRKIAFASSRSGSHEIWICDSDGGHPIQLTNIGAPYYTAGAHWSPDGQTIVFSSNAMEKRSKYLIAVPGGTPKGSISMASRAGRETEVSICTIKRKRRQKSFQNAGGRWRLCTCSGQDFWPGCFRVRRRSVSVLPKRRREHPAPKPERRRRGQGATFRTERQLCNCAGRNILHSQRPTRSDSIPQLRRRKDFHDSEITPVAFIWILSLARRALAPLHPI